MRREDTRRTLPFLDEALLRDQIADRVPRGNCAVAAAQISTPTPVPMPEALGFIGFIGVDSVGDDQDVTIRVVRGRPGHMDREAIALQIASETKKPVRRVHVERA